MVSSRYKRNEIRVYYAQSVQADHTLLAELEAALITARAALPNGLAIAGTSANDHSTQFSLPGTGGPGPQENYELIDELIRRHDAAAAVLVGAGDSNPADLEIRDQMLADVHAIRRLRVDFTHVEP